MRRGLREKMRSSILCDGSAYAKDVESKYRWMWRERVATKQKVGSPRDVPLRSAGDEVDAKRHEGGGFAKKADCD
jgi:hypothetical protein